MKPHPIIYPRYFNSEKYKLTYLEMPKSACTSIKSYLGCPNDHIPCWPDYPVFSVVRDPVQRFVSGFIQLKRHGRTKGAETIYDFLEVIDHHGFYDRHIAPQTWFIEQHYQISKDITLYHLDDYLSMYDLPVLNASDFKIELSDEQALIVQELYKVDYKIPIEMDV